MRQAGLDQVSSEVIDILLNLLEAGVEDILILASELVESQIDASWNVLLGRLGVLELLAVSIHLVCKGRGLELLRVLQVVVQVQSSELLSGQVEELLLELLLPLREVEFGGQELSSDIGIHVTVIVLDRGRSQDLVGSIVHHLLLTIVVADSASEAGTNRSLGNATVHVVIVVVAGVGLSGKAALVCSEIVLVLSIGGRGRGLGGGGSLGSGAQASEQVRAAGARSLHLSVLGDGGNLWG